MFLDDIAVRFYQLDENGDLQWEGYGDFGPADVHRQVELLPNNESNYN